MFNLSGIYSDISMKYTSNFFQIVSKLPPKHNHAMSYRNKTQQLCIFSLICIILYISIYISIYSLIIPFSPLFLLLFYIKIVINFPSEVVNLQFQF